MHIEYGQHAVIISFGGSAWEEWYVVHRHEDVTYHGENDGWTFLRKGAEASERSLTRAQFWEELDHRRSHDLLEIYQAVAIVDHTRYHAHLCVNAPPHSSHWHPCILANCGKSEQSKCTTHWSVAG
jgi:hypothetical protein